MNKIFEVWGSELEPLYVLDLGDRLLNLGLWHIRGRGSGVPLDQELAQLVTVRNGLVVRDQNVSSWAEGLHAAGLEPDAISLPASRCSGLPHPSSEPCGNPGLGCLRAPAVSPDRREELVAPEREELDSGAGGDGCGARDVADLPR